MSTDTEKLKALRSKAIALRNKFESDDFYIFARVCDDLIDAINQTPEMKAERKTALDEMLEFSGKFEMP